MMLWERVLGILGLAALCGLWVVFQGWLARRDPGLPGIEDRCGSCGVPECEEGKPPPRRDLQGDDNEGSGPEVAHPSPSGLY